MKRIFENRQEEYLLSGNNIDLISELVGEQAEKLSYTPVDIYRIRLSVEEILLVWQEKFGEDGVVTLRMGSRLRKPYLSLECAGENCDPIETGSHGEWGQSILSRLGLSPSYSYTKGKNIVRFELKPPAMNPMIPIVFALLLAILCGSGGMFLPADFRLAMAGEVLPIISDTFFGVLGMVAAPLIFFSVTIGICGIGDTATLGGLGKKLMQRFFLVTLLAAMSCAAVLTAFLGLKIAEVSGGMNGSIEILEMLFGMVPVNLFEPFLNGNFMHILVLAVLIGVAMLLKPTAELYRVMEQCQSVFGVIMGWIGSLLPVAIFVIVVQNMWSGSLDELLGMWQPLVFSIGMMAVLVTVYLLYVALRLHVKPMLLMRKLMPGCMVALTTASSSAAFGDAVICCTKKFGIQKKMVDFGIPLGIVLCCPGNVVVFVTCVLYSVHIYDVKISVMGIVLTILLCTFLMISAPPMAGGAMSCYAILFAQLNIPTEGLGVVMALVLLLDFFGTAVDFLGQQLTLLLRADEEKLLDLQILKMNE